MNDFNGTLAMIRLQEQTEAIVNLINNRTTDRTSAVTFGTRRNGTNSAYINGDLISTSDFQNWAPLEPNNYLPNKDCGALLTNEKWNDDVCSAKHNFLCKEVNNFNVAPRPPKDTA